MKQYSLYELNRLVKDSITESMTEEYWVRAELSECYEKGGHCYLELVEKGKKSNTFIAKARAIIWADTWGLLKYSFEKTTGQHLARGMQVLMQVYPNFHESFGFSWIVTDIDPTFTLGDIAKKRQEIIQQLKDEGVFDLNKFLTLPLFCQRIAVISSESAAGFGDFSNQLLNNTHGFHFSVTLFPAIMQGEMVERSIIAALDKIYDCADSFDCVVIIRGGGASSDLTGFDTYPLAANVAQFPLPIITGIGHERDDTVLDLVSNTRVKTPTAAAEFLVSRLEET
ncbi:MAG: exodeoxyribonuclease VII large subunit, partial [Prevotellaceae bacterium]|nr:exodeoxyribonuclease VII large subunit [Prevotellaceae bacterium]